MEILHANLGLHGNGLQHLNTYMVAPNWKMLCGNVFIVILGIHKYAKQAGAELGQTQLKGVAMKLALKSILPDVA